MKKDTLLFKFNNAGQSLIQVLVAMSIMGIMAVALSNMMFTQQKQIKFLESKQDILTIRNALLRVFSKSLGFCPSANTALGDIKFPIANIPNQISFNKIFESNSVELMSVTNGTRESNLLDVSSIQFQNFTGSGDNYSADLVVKLSQKDTTLIALKPITILNLSILTQTDPSDPSKKQVIGCTATDAVSLTEIDLKQKKCHLTVETGGAPGTNVSCNPNEYVAGIYMVAAGGGDVDDAALLCCSANESSFSGLFTQNNKYWTSYSGGSESNPPVMCLSGYFISGLECNYNAPGDADQCKLQCSLVEDTIMRSKFDRVGCYSTPFSYSAQSRVPTMCPTGTYGAGIEVNVGAPSDWDQTSLVCCGLSK